MDRDQWSGMEWKWNGRWTGSGRGGIRAADGGVQADRLMEIWKEELERPVAMEARTSPEYWAADRGPGAGGWKTQWSFLAGSDERIWHQI